MDTSQLQAITVRVWGRTFAIILENTELGSTTSDDQDSLGAAVTAHEWHQPWLFSACYSFHISLCFPVCYSSHWMKPPHLRAEGQSLSPTGPSKTAPADGAFTSYLAIHTVLWRMRSQASALFWNSHTQKRSLLCSSPIMINPGKYTALKTGRALNPEGSGGVGSDRWSKR